jgi:hypothetical protein
MGLGFGSNEGSSPADPPFAQLGGQGSRGWRDTLQAGAVGAFNATAPDEMKNAVAGVGDMRAFQRRRDAAKHKQQQGGEAGERQMIRDRAEQFLGNKGPSDMGGGDE